MMHVQQISSTLLHSLECLPLNDTEGGGAPVILLRNLGGGLGGGLRNGT